MKIDIDANSATEPVVVMSRTFDAPREVVWAAFTDPKHVVNWYGARKRIEKGDHVERRGRWCRRRTCNGRPSTGELDPRAAWCGAGREPPAGPAVFARRSRARARVFAPLVQCSSNSPIWRDRWSWRRRSTRLCQ